MRTEFEILSAFLGRSTTEVEGRSLEEPPTQVRAQIRTFVRGELPAAHREHLVQQLLQNPNWVERLAEEARKLRPETRSRD